MEEACIMCVQHEAGWLVTLKQRCVVSRVYEQRGWTENSGF